MTCNYIIYVIYKNVVSFNIILLINIHACLFVHLFKVMIRHCGNQYYAKSVVENQRNGLLK